MRRKRPRPKVGCFFFADDPRPLLDSHFSATIRCVTAGKSPPLLISAIMGAEAVLVQERLERWAQRLQNLTVSPLTRDYPETQKADSAKRAIEAFESFKLPADTQLELKKLSESSGSPFSVFLTAFVILVARLTGDEDIAIGTSSADDGRPFVLRVPVDASEPFLQLYAKVVKVCCFIPAFLAVLTLSRPSKRGRRISYL